MGTAQTTPALPLPLSSAQQSCPLPCNKTVMTGAAGAQGEGKPHTYLRPPTHTNLTSDEDAGDGDRLSLTHAAQAPLATPATKQVWSAAMAWRRHCAAAKRGLYWLWSPGTLTCNTQQAWADSSSGSKQQHAARQQCWSQACSNCRQSHQLLGLPTEVAWLHFTQAF